MYLSILLRFSQTCEFWSSKANWRLRFSLPSIILTDLRYNFPLNKTSWKHLNIKKFPAEAHSVIPSVNFLIKTVNIWWSWTRTNLVPNFLPVAALWENKKTLGTRLGESPQYPGGGGEGTATYRLYRYVPLWSVWFSSSLLCDRVRDTNQNQDPGGISPPKNS